MFFGCNAIKRVKKNELLLKKNTFIVDGKIIKSGDKNLALKLEEKGYDWLQTDVPV